jgi:hypothetical protein
MSDLKQRVVEALERTCGVTVEYGPVFSKMVAWQGKCSTTNPCPTCAPKCALAAELRDHAIVPVAAPEDAGRVGPVVFVEYEAPEARYIRDTQRELDEHDAIVKRRPPSRSQGGQVKVDHEAARRAAETIVAAGATDHPDRAPIARLEAEGEGQVNIRRLWCAVVGCHYDLIRVDEHYSDGRRTSIKVMFARCARCGEVKE